MRGGRGGFPDLSWDGGKGWAEVVHMLTSVTCVTEENFYFVQGALEDLTLGILVGGRAAVGVGVGGMDTAGGADLAQIPSLAPS